MRLILTEDVPSLGNAGDVVRVKRGYGRNYLLPQGKAQLATETRVREIEHQKRVIDEKVQKEVLEHRATGEKLAKVSLEFEMQTNEEGKLFGSVTNGDILERLVVQGFEIDRRKIELPEPIKQVGEHEVNVRLHREVQVSIRVNVSSSGAVAVIEEEDEPSAAEVAMEEAEGREREEY
jgi:large subunit ribosomal protein L9